MRSAPLTLTMAFAVGLVAGLAVPPASAAAANQVDLKLETVERAIARGRKEERRLGAEAATLELQIMALRAELVTTARSAQNHEDELGAIEARIGEFSRAEAEKSAGLQRRQKALVATLGALERLSRRPPEALIATPASLIDTSRSSLLLGAVVPRLSAEAGRLREELTALAVLRDRLDEEYLRLARTGEALDAERRNIADILGRKSAMQSTTLAARRTAEAEVALLASQANDLRELLEKLTTLPPPAPKPALPEPAAGPAPGTVTAALPLSRQEPVPSLRSFSAARGTLPAPVRGRIVRLFGQNAETGLPYKGIVIETRAGAQVVNPYDGRVVFAGPFRGYGQLLIIEHGEGYHMLLAGFSRIDSVLGQWLLAGEPVGVMGSDSDGKPRLYVELRRGGNAINPLPWMAESVRKVSG